MCMEVCALCSSFVCLYAKWGKRYVMYECSCLRSIRSE